MFVAPPRHPLPQMPEAYLLTVIVILTTVFMGLLFYVGSERSASRSIPAFEIHKTYQPREWVK